MDSTRLLYKYTSDADPHLYLPPLAFSQATLVSVKA